MVIDETKYTYLCELKNWLVSIRPGCYPLDPAVSPYIKLLFYEQELTTSDGYPMLEISACEKYFRKYDEAKGAWPASPLAKQREENYKNSCKKIDPSHDLPEIIVPETPKVLEGGGKIEKEIPPLIDPNQISLF